jgi:hypothetical protein
VKLIQKETLTRQAWGKTNGQLDYRSFVALTKIRQRSAFAVNHSERAIVLLFRDKVVQYRTAACGFEDRHGWLHTHRASANELFILAHSQQLEMALELHTQNQRML